MLKILQARLQQYVNQELPYAQTGLRKGRGTRDQIANIHLIMEKARGFQKNHLLLLHWLHWSLWLCESKQCKILKQTRVPEHLACLLRNLYAGQEATVSTWHWITDWFQIRKWVCQGCIVSPCLFSLYSGHRTRFYGSMRFPSNTVEDLLGGNWVFRYLTALIP